MRFVMAKKAGVPEITIHRVSRPASRAYPIRGPIISATPPPRGVELTCQITRPRHMSATRPNRSAARR